MATTLYAPCSSWMDSKLLLYLWSVTPRQVSFCETTYAEAYLIRNWAHLPNPSYSLPQPWSRLIPTFTLLSLRRRLPTVEPSDLDGSLCSSPRLCFLLKGAWDDPVDHLQAGSRHQEWAIGRWAYPLYKLGLLVNFRGFEQKGLSWPPSFLAVWSLSAPACLSGEPSSSGHMQWLHSFCLNVLVLVVRSMS